MVVQDRLIAVAVLLLFCIFFATLFFFMMSFLPLTLFLFSQLLFASRPSTGPYQFHLLGITMPVDTVSVFFVSFISLQYIYCC